MRDILLVLIIAAENYSLHHSGAEFVRLLVFCQRTCTYFRRCLGADVPAFADIHHACAMRIRNFRKAPAARRRSADGRADGFDGEALDGGVLDDRQRLGLVRSELSMALRTSTRYS